MSKLARYACVTLACMRSPGCFLQRHTNTHLVQWLVHTDNTHTHTHTPHTHPPCTLWHLCPHTQRHPTHHQPPKQVQGNNKLKVGLQAKNPVLLREAIDFYKKGLGVCCSDNALNVALYNNKAHVNSLLGGVVRGVVVVFAGWCWKLSSRPASDV